MKANKIMMTWVIYILLINVYGLIQDIVGKERWLAFMGKMWIDSKISMPIHIAFIIVVFIFSIVMLVLKKHMGLEFTKDVKQKVYIIKNRYAIYKVCKTAEEAEKYMNQLSSNFMMEVHECE